MNDIFEQEQNQEYTYTPSNRLQKQIDKLTREDAEQQKKTLSYYLELKKTNPKLYLDPKMAIEMDRSAQYLGEAFFDTND
jgi:hypothetical protein